MAMISKDKVPEKILSRELADYYRENGNIVLDKGRATIGYRYDNVEKRKFRMPNGQEHTNNVTLSQPSSEVLNLMKDGDKWFIVMGKQSRSPYIVDVDGIPYFKIFLEQAAGLVEEKQDFKVAAIAESSQEFGARLIYLTELIVPKLYRHVSYTDEVSKLYLAVTEKLGIQNLDCQENINTAIIPLDEARSEFFDYLNGVKPSFFGFDIPDITMLSMMIFFWKLDAKEIDLDNLNRNIL